MKTGPAEKKPFSLQQAGGISLVNGMLTVNNRNGWTATTPSMASNTPEENAPKAYWQMDGFIPKTQTSFRMPVTLSLLSTSRLREILVTAQTGTPSASLYANGKLVRRGQKIEKGSRVDIAFASTSAKNISFTIHLEVV
jgi:hypothetical protein